MGPGRRVARLVTLGLMLIAFSAASYIAIHSWEAGFYPFGNEANDQDGCLRESHADSIYAGYKNVHAMTDKSIFPLGVLCEISAVKDDRITDGSVMSFVDWPATMGLAASISVAIVSIVISSRLLVAMGAERSISGTAFASVGPEESATSLPQR